MSGFTLGAFERVASESKQLRDTIVLGLETSCDETAASVVRGRPPGPGQVLSNIVLSQLEEHAPFGGVVPEIAARAHMEALDSIVETAIRDAGVSPDDLDAVAATAGPGLVGGVMIGLMTAKALALAWNKPLVAVNHLEAHALTVRLTGGIAFPYLLLLISGGHCQLLAVENVGGYRLYGTTLDDAAGEAFDKVAKLLELPYPGGPALEALAMQGDARAFQLPRPMVGREGADFSFSGLKTAVRQIVRQAPPLGPADRADLAAGFQAALIDCLIDRTRSAMRLFRAELGASDEFRFVVAGGVAANAAIRTALNNLAGGEGFEMFVPPPGLCTDNAAMVAWAGLERHQLGCHDNLDAVARPRWPLFEQRR